ncbi:MAG: hypothetical protein PUG89_09990, partial [Succinivibrio sp.]|nr:hypothetical protein [Succinivibrio sp.]
VKDFAKHKFLNKKVEKYVADLATKKADHELALKYVSKVEISDFKAKKRGRLYRYYVPSCLL